MKRKSRPAERKPLQRHAPRRNRRRPNYFLMFVIFASVAIVSGTTSYVFTTPTLDVAKIDIKGVHLADGDAIEAIASAAVGRNILLVRTGRTCAKVRLLCEVRDVRMGRRYPNTLWLRVWERKPDAVIASGGRVFWTQADGLVFHCAKSAPAGVSRIEAAGCGARPGERIQSAGILGALQALQLARQKGIKAAKITVDPDGQICLNMDGGFRVFLGDPSEIARKMIKLKKALVRRPSLVRDGSYLNLSAPSAPAWMPKNAAPS